MDWLINLFTTQDSIAHIVLLYGIVIAIGIMLGKLKIAGISLGVTFVLFCGIVAGHFGFTAPRQSLTSSRISVLSCSSFALACKWVLDSSRVSRKEAWHSMACRY